MSPGWVGGDGVMEYSRRGRRRAARERERGTAES